MWKRNHGLREVLRMQVAALFCVGVWLASSQLGHGQALVAVGAIDLKGNSIMTDSFDSSAPDYPGYWTSSIRKAGGDVVTLSSLTNFNIGNASVAGHVRTGSGGSISLGPSGSVGDLAWVDAFTPGVELGWSSDDAHIAIRNVVIPTVPWTVAPGSGSATVYYYTGTNITATNLHSFSHVITSPGNYTINNSGDIYVGTNCTVNLWVLSSAGTFAPNYLYEAGRGTNAARVTCYVDCTNCTLGTSDSAQGWLAQNMVFLGTTNCTSLKYSGNGDFTAALYFPQANFQLSGGGSGIVDFIGCSVTKTVQFNGHYHFHFDEALAQKGLPMPLFPDLPSNCSALVGQNVTLSASPVSLQPFNYQWQFGGTNIPDATNSSLALTNVQQSDAGVYQLAITNASGSFTTGERLYVYDSPVPTIKNPLVSTNSVFQVTIIGVPGFKYALEVSTNLSDWVPIITNTSPFIFSDTNAALWPQQFYRAVYVP